MNPATAFEIRYHEDALAGYIGTPIKGHPQFRRLLQPPIYVYYRADENREAIEGCIFGARPERYRVCDACASVLYRGRRPSKDKNQFV